MQSRVGRSANSASSLSAGAISEEQFRAAFESVPNIKLESLRDLIAECQNQAVILENVNNDWTKRTKAVRKTDNFTKILQLQTVRALIKNDIGCYAAFAEQVYSLLGNALELSVKDLRSTLCREACITIAYYSEKLGVGFWRICESILPITMNLTQNSAKIMATSGQICNIYIAKYVHHPKVLSIIVQQSAHKAKEIRRMAIALVAIIVNSWDPNMVERHSAELLQTIKLAISDADPEARATARQAFENLQNNYPHKAEALFQELEPGKQKMLTDRTSTASSTHSINSERDNLPTSNRGLYGAQSAFLNKRSASDLNHAVRRLNLVPPRIVHRPNVKSGGRPPQATPSTPLNSRVPASTPTIQPNSTNRLQKSQSVTNNTANAKAISQPSSRSNSPNRNRHPVPHPTVSRTNLASGAASKKLANGSGTGITNTPLKPNPMQSASHRELAQGITKALKNVDIQSRSIRPNVIRSDDPRAYANSPNTHYTPRLSDSPQDFYGLTRKQEAALIRINNAEGNGNELGANRRRKSSSTQQVKQELSNEEYENSNNKWSYLSAEELSDDPDKQDAFIQQICDILSDQEAAEKEVEGALQILTRMIREGGITRWDAYFNNIFFAIQQVISHPLNDSLATRIGALKAMKELCMSQPKRLVTKTELLLMNILNAHENDDATVVRAAEDCGAALASRLPTTTCMNLLLTVIDDENSKYHQLSGAIKMLSNVIAKLPPDEVEKSLHAVAERMTRCYENSQSMVRRAAIICLVSISNAIGLENLKPHLNQSTLKLVEVYAARMTKKDNSS